MPSMINAPAAAASLAGAQGAVAAEMMEVSAEDPKVDDTASKKRKTAAQQPPVAKPAAAAGELQGNVPDDKAQRVQMRIQANRQAQASAGVSYSALQAALLASEDNVTRLSQRVAELELALKTAKAAG
jgi:hypothetical protein